MPQTALTCWYCCPLKSIWLVDFTKGIENSLDLKFKVKKISKDFPIVLIKAFHVWTQEKD